MKTTSLLLTQGARLLLMTCATLASCLFSLGTAAAQSADNTWNFSADNSNSGETVLNGGSLTVENCGALGTESVILNGGNLILATGASCDSLTWKNPNSVITITKPDTSKLQVNQLILTAPTSTYIFDVTPLDNNSHELISYLNSPDVVASNFSISGQNPDSYQFSINSKDAYQHLEYKIPTDAHITIQDTKTITDSLTVDTLSFDTDSTLTVDGTLTVKNIFCDAPNATMILCPNAVVDLRGSTLTVSSLTLADGTQIADGQTLLFGSNSYSKTFVSVLKNGAGVINGTVTIDSTHANALHLIESNNHSSEQGSGTVTLIPSSPCSVSSGATFSNASLTQQEQPKLN